MGEYEAPMTSGSVLVAVRGQVRKIYRDLVAGDYRWILELADDHSRIGAEKGFLVCLAVEESEAPEDLHEGDTVQGRGHLRLEWQLGGPQLAVVAAEPGTLRILREVEAVAS